MEANSFTIISNKHQRPDHMFASTAENTRVRREIRLEENGDCGNSSKASKKFMQGPNINEQ